MKKNKKNIRYFIGCVLIVIAIIITIVGIINRDSNAKCKFRLNGPLVSLTADQSFQ